MPEYCSVCHSALSSSSWSLGETTASQLRNARQFRYGRDGMCPACYERTTGKCVECGGAGIHRTFDGAVGPHEWTCHRCDGTGKAR